MYKLHGKIMNITTSIRYSWEALKFQNLGYFANETDY